MKYEVFLSDNTKKRIKTALAGDIHALIVESPLAGQSAQINAYVEHVSSVTPGVSIVIQPKDKSIGIDDVKSLRLQFSLRNTSGEKRLIFINHAHTMTHEAQNALLKILEEPPEGTIFVINTAGLDQLLPTVLSRGAPITAEKPSQEILSNYFTSKGYKPAEISQALAISNGWPELAENILLNESTDFIDELNFAKQLLQSSLTKKLKEVETLSKQKQRIPLLLFALERLSHAANTSHIQTKAQVNEKWLNIMVAVERAQLLNKHNVNSRLLLTELMTKL